jgi:ABC-type sugar transport system ATPase subunit
MEQRITAGEGAQPPFLSLRHVSKRFGGVHALRDVSFDCRLGEVHALAGENGAGKSTLIKIIAGAHAPDEGEVVIHGQRYTALHAATARQLGVSVIYQEFNLLPDLTVSENIHLGIEPTRRGMIDLQAMRAASAGLLRRLGASVDVDAYVRELSVARQQIVEIAKALALDARLVVMDEPSAVLAGHELEQLFNVIRTLREQGRAVIYISHRLDEVFAIADRVTVLKDGSVVATWPTSKVTKPTLIQAMVGRDVAAQFPARTRAIGQVVLHATGIAAGPRLRDVDLELRAGEIVGVGGLVGSGRTRLARTLAGAERLTAGHADLDGTPLPRSVAGCIEHGIVMVPEDRTAEGLFLDKTVRFNVGVANLDRLTWGPVIRTALERAFVLAAMARLDVRPAKPDHTVSAYSGGNQQKIVLSKWLAREPKVLIVDEPTRGIDVGAKAEIYALLRQLADEGAAILMVSSELPELIGMCDRILVMSSGHIVGELAADQASEERILEMAIQESAA